MDTTTLLIYIGAGVGFLCLVGWILSLFFQSSTLAKEAKKQTLLLIKMAEKNGVSQDEIDGIVNSLT